MSEIKGGIFVIIFFLGFIVPGVLMFGIDSLHQNSFMKMTTEVSELVKEEGAINSRVLDVVSGLEEKGYEITFTDDSGSAVNGKIEYGETVYINYEYNYDSVREVRTLTTSNRIFNMKR